MVLTVKVRGIFSVLVRYLGNIARGFIRLFKGKSHDGFADGTVIY